MGRQATPRAPGARDEGRRVSPTYTAFGVAFGLRGSCKQPAF
jgi:hypothetical protein